MNIADYVKEHVYLPYFRRQSKEVRLQQILLGLGIGLALIALGGIAWYVIKRRGDGDCCDGCCCDGDCSEIPEEAGV
jgi:hypothetical protein